MGAYRFLCWYNEFLHPVKELYTSVTDIFLRPHFLL